MAQKNYWVKAGFWSFTHKDQKYNGGLNLRKVIKWALRSLNVTFWDECCPEEAPTTYPVRVRVEGETTLLEYFNGTEWVEYVAPEVAP